MDDYVFVFDNTPYTENQQDFMTISIGLKNKDSTQLGVEAQYDSTSSLYAPNAEDTTTDAKKSMIEEAPVDDDESDPVDIPPMTDDGITSDNTEANTDDQVDVDIDPEFKDAVAPKFDAAHPPAPGLSLEYAYYLWTQIGNITAFITSSLGAIMSVYHKILG